MAWCVSSTCALSIEVKVKVVSYQNNWCFKLGTFIILKWQSGVTFHSLLIYHLSRIMFSIFQHETWLKSFIYLFLLESERVLLSDPKGAIVQKCINGAQKTSSNFPKTKLGKKLEAREDNPKVREILEFLRSRPYRADTAFGYTTLIDTRLQLRDTVFRKKHIPGTGLDDGELLALDYLIEGRFYSSTGGYYSKSESEV